MRKRLYSEVLKELPPEEAKAIRRVFYRDSHFWRKVRKHEVCVEEIGKIGKRK